MTAEQPTKKPRPWWHWALAAAGTAVFIVLLIWGPWWIEGHHLRDGKGQLVSSAGIIVTGFRTMLIALAAGGFTAAGLYYTREKHQLEREQFQHAQEQFAENQAQFETTLRETQERDQKQTELTREGQVTGRYVEAIKLLASEGMHERLGGIYALERIMIDSDRDHEMIVEVLAAFVRIKLHEAKPALAGLMDEASRQRHLFALSEDVAATLAVLSKRNQTRDKAAVANLSGIYLPRHVLIGVDWRQLKLERAKLDGSNIAHARLDGAILDGATLAAATLTGASLRGASLAHADLHSADLVYADLTGARLDSVNLLQAVMNNAKLKGARLPHARLEQASLNSAQLVGANLANAHLEGARMGGANLADANLQSADLRRVNLTDAELDGANLAFANLADADLRRAKLDKATGLTAQALRTTDLIYPSTKLPPHIASDAAIQAIIQDSQDRDDDESEAAYAAAMELEEEMINGAPPVEG